jgi:hypothetical protein
MATTEPLLSIGEVAARAGLRTSHIRYYERVGMLPLPDRLGGQRRWCRHPSPGRPGLPCLHGIAVQSRPVFPYMRDAHQAVWDALGRLERLVVLALAHWLVRR